VAAGCPGLPGSERPEQWADLQSRDAYGDMEDWFNCLSSKQVGSCCSNFDGRPPEAIVVDLLVSDCDATPGAGRVMSQTPTRRKPLPKLDRVLAAYNHRARLVAQMREQAIAGADALSHQRTVRRQKAEAWFCAGAFLLSLSCLVALGCVLAILMRHL
jgi:hypothetical protein